MFFNFLKLFLLQLQDMNEEHYYNKLEEEDNDRNIILAMKNATFTWATAMVDQKQNDIQESTRKSRRKLNSQSKYKHIQRRDSSIEATSSSRQSELNQPFVLTNLSFHVKRGDLVCIIGKVGSGKSSLLNAILAEMIKVDGEICTLDSKAGKNKTNIVY